MGRDELTIVTGLMVGVAFLPLYESIWWWDIVMHTGCTAIIVLWLSEAGLSVAQIVLTILAVSLGWEVFEFVTPRYIFMSGGLADTMSDIIFNMIGAKIGLRWAT